MENELISLNVEFEVHKMWHIISMVLYLSPHGRVGSYVRSVSDSNNWFRVCGAESTACT